MADITNKNELKRRIDLFLDELDYSINEEFCKATMKMMREFIGHASHRLDCEDSRVKSLKKKLKEYKDFEEIFREKMTDTACEFLKDKEEFGKWLDRNKWIAKKCDEYARAEEQGLLLRLPCKVGDTVYAIGFNNNKPFVYESVVLNILITEKEIVFNVKVDEFEINSQLKQSMFGRTVFLTQAEAEQKLKEMESD